MIGGETFDWTFFRDSYPKFECWRALRAELDPDEIFVTDYWRERLGLSAPLPS